MNTAGDPKNEISAASLVYNIEAEFGDRIFAADWLKARPDLWMDPEVAEAWDRYVRGDQDQAQAFGDLQALAEAKASGTKPSSLVPRIYHEDLASSGPGKGRKIEFTQIGVDVSGRRVFECNAGMLHEAVQAIVALVKRTREPMGLLWNGVATVCYPQMTSEEFLIENEVRRVAYRAKEFPQKLMAFGPEVDPFEITGKLP